MAAATATRVPIPPARVVKVSPMPRRPSTAENELLNRTSGGGIGVGGNRSNTRYGYKDKAAQNTQLALYKFRAAVTNEPSCDRCSIGNGCEAGKAGGCGGDSATGTTTGVVKALPPEENTCSAVFRYGLHERNVSLARFNVFQALLRRRGKQS